MARALLTKDEFERGVEEVKSALAPLFAQYPRYWLKWQWTEAKVGRPAFGSAWIITPNGVPNWLGDYWSSTASWVGDLREDAVDTLKALEEPE